MIHNCAQPQPENIQPNKSLEKSQSNASSNQKSISKVFSYMYQSETNVDAQQSKYQEQQPKNCRICLEEETYDNKLISPCKCIGSVQLVHWNCEKMWIEKLLQKDANTEIICEMCKYSINYEISQNFVRIGCEEIEENISANKGYFIFLIITMIMEIGLIVFTLLFLPQHIEKGSYGLISLTVVVISVIIVIEIVLLIRAYFLKRQKEVIQISEINSTFQTNQINVTNMYAMQEPPQ